MRRHVWQGGLKVRAVKRTRVGGGALEEKEYNKKGNVRMGGKRSRGAKRWRAFAQG